MNLSFSDAEAAVREHFSNFFAKESRLEVVRRSEPLGFDQELWDKTCATGAPSMGIPEAFGGGGATTIEMAILAEECGRNMAPVPLIEHLAATRAIALADQGDFLVSLTDGSTLATVALTPARNGILRSVPAGAVADVVVLLDRGELVAIRHTSSSRPTSPRNFGCSPIADWFLEAGDVERIVLARGDNAKFLYSDAVSTWRLLTAASLNGLGARALGVAVNYVKERKAFDVPIGWFQAVRHRLADQAVASDGSALLAYEAAWADELGDPGAQRLSTMAFIFASETAFRTCREALQFHGGYGVTLEYDIQLFFRRAKSWPLAIGDIRNQYRELGDEIYPLTKVDTNNAEAIR